MALKSVEGKYLKVIRELTEFRPTGVTVYYYEFKSEKDRDEYFYRQAAVRAFLEECTQRKRQMDEEIAKEMAALKREIKSEADIPVHVKKMMDDAEQFIIDADTVGNYWDKPEPMPRLSTQKLLEECGFKKEWKTPLSDWSINALNTGAFTNQNFTYECLYHELKKIFKDDFVDC